MDRQLQQLKRDNLVEYAVKASHVMNWDQRRLKFNSLLGVPTEMHFDLGNVYYLKGFKKPWVLGPSVEVIPVAKRFQEIPHSIFLEVKLYIPQKDEFAVLSCQNKSSRDLGRWLSERIGKRVKLDSMVVRGRQGIQWVKPVIDEE